jgi:hypothetical protein
MFDLKTLTFVHTAVSLLDLAVGLIVLYGLSEGRRLKPWMGLFIGGAWFTSLSGFLFPIAGPTPALIVGVVAILVLILVFAAQTKGWRRIFAGGIVVSVYFQAFVTVAQSFAKIPALKALAPTQTEPPFAIAQLVVLIAFVLAGVVSVKKAGGGAVAPA